MDFFDEFMSHLGDEKLREEFMDLLMPNGVKGEDKMITGHHDDYGNLVMSVFSREEWQMLEEMSRIIAKPIEDIIKELGPDEVHQLYIGPD
jgi:hypothetical protein